MRANIAHAHDHGANGSAGVLVGDARQLPRPLTRNARDFLERDSLTDAARLGLGVADLILTSPPYACARGGLSSDQTTNGGALVEQRGRNRRQLLAGANRAHAARLVAIYCHRLQLLAADAPW
jgi:hypothetical protein